MLSNTTIVITIHRAILWQNIAKMNEAKRELVIQQCLATHYAEYNGHLPYNGVIKGYQFTIKQRNEMVDTIEYDLP
ncbi:hypothetical protein ACTXKB_11690 [Psychrobacter aquimaris]|uniref:hypothetical protein n=1 Tax=Psychrobacter aquimaris TaxID=292733 RepID=UPI003FD5DF4F